jgi:hypothetical protein
VEIIMIDDKIDWMWKLLWLMTRLIECGNYCGWWLMVDSWWLMNDDWWLIVDYWIYWMCKIIMNDEWWLEILHVKNLLCVYEIIMIDEWW